MAFLYYLGLKLPYNYVCKLSQFNHLFIVWALKELHHFLGAWVCVIISHNISVSLSMKKSAIEQVVEFVPNVICRA